MDVLFPMRNLPKYQGLKFSFEHNRDRKNLFLSACFCWDSRVSSPKVDQISSFGGTIVYGASYLEFLFRLFVVFRLHERPIDADGAVWEHSGKGPGYLYIIGPGSNSCLLGQVTGLLFCLLGKTFFGFRFQLCRFLKQHVLHCNRYGASR